MACRGVKVLRLYEIQRGPPEKHDLAQEAPMKPVVTEMFTRLTTLQRKMNDDLDLSTPARTEFPVILRRRC